MLLTRWWSFVLGYVAVKIEGEFIEKLLNMASSRGIILWDIRLLSPGSMLINVRIHGFKKMRHIARKQRCKMKIQAKRGLPFFLKRLEQRKGFVVGAISFSIILYLLSSFVWFIDIQGIELVKPEQILAVAERQGLRIGAAKWELNPDQVEKEIGNIPQIAWVGVKIKGTRVLIEVAEKVLPEVTADETIPAHLVAAKDGLVYEVLNLNGVAVVKPGDTVQKGQVLISGYVFPGAIEGGQAAEGTARDIGEPLKTRAKGIVRARVWYEATSGVLLEEHGYNKTGKFVETVAVKIMSKEIIVRGPKQTPFPNYSTKVETKKPGQWRDMTMPVELIYKTYYELEEFHRSYTREEALQAAVKEAKGRISLYIPPTARVVNNLLTELAGTEHNRVEIRLTVEAIEDIATPQAIP